MKGTIQPRQSLTQRAFVDGMAQYLNLRGISNTWCCENYRGHLFFQYDCPQCCSVWVDYSRKEQRVTLRWEVCGFSHCRVFTPQRTTDDIFPVMWEVLPH